MDQLLHVGYRPISLTLKGFRGIRSGLGRDELTLDLDELAGEAKLVAITGANGRGKTTVMDNLHPYTVMPSRAGADGLGAFSYYDHVYLPESEKVLIWRHAGRVFKSHLVFRVNGKKKTEAFLFEQEVADHWVPVRLPDGTVSDGKVETYERAVAQVLGPQETFFTSVFSAQGKRPLSAFKNGEVKALLGDLLGLEYVREQGAKAADVVRDLRAGLGILRREASEAQARVGQIDATVTSYGDTSSGIVAAQAAKAGAATALEQAQQALALATAEQAAAGDVEARRRALVDDRARAVKEREDAVKRVTDELRRLEVRDRALGGRIQVRKTQHADRRRALIARQAKLRAALSLAPQVTAAARRSPLAQRVVEVRADRQSAAQGRVDAAEQLKAKAGLERQAIAATEREAGQVALRHADLERRFGLAAAVPCAGTDYARRCQLLGDAREAQALLPSATAQLQGLAQRKAEYAAGLLAAEQALVAMGDVASARNRAEARLERAQARVQRLLVLAAREGEVEQARQMMVTLEAELAACAAEPEALTSEESVEQTDIATARGRLADERARVDAVVRVALERVDGQLGQLPAQFDVARVATLRRALEQAQRAMGDAESTVARAVRRAEEHKSAMAQREGAHAQQGKAEQRSRGIELELSSWTLLAKCLSNDGIVALDIDDAGPTFSALANDLLLACYGPRFTLEVITQTQTAKGELREDFDILVHDGWRDESKSLKLVSGGERVWINECLTRAIALYLADNTSRRLSTLFCDEADGPLDPEHKRMFMAMKREVLRVGGYETEFFVSQTPELTAMADRVIDLDAMALTAVDER
jgi:DNA repair protein SbcC/Rad50